MDLVSVENGGAGDQRQLEEQMNEGVAYGRWRNEELDNVLCDEENNNDDQEEHRAVGLKTTEEEEEEEEGKRRRTIMMILKTRMSLQRRVGETQCWVHGVVGTTFKRIMMRMGMRMRREKTMRLRGAGGQERQKEKGKEN